VVRQALRVLQGMLGPREQREMQERLVKVEPQAQWDPPDNQDQQDQLVPQVQLDH